MSKKQKNFLKDQEYSILDKIFSESSIMLTSFLLSGMSTKRMYEIESKMRAKRVFSKKRTLDNLKKQGYVKINKDKVILTKLGEEIYRQNKIVKSLKDESKKWDGKWRMLTFDIPNDINEIRYLLRGLLLKAGFLQIQKSVYIYPHNVNELLSFLQKHKEFKKYIIYLEISFSTNSKDWLKKFKKIIK